MKLLTTFAATLVSASCINLEAQLTGHHTTGDELEDTLLDNERTLLSQVGKDKASKAIVIHLGQEFLSVGFSNQDQPSSVFPNVCGTPLGGETYSLIGDAALQGGAGDAFIEKTPPMVKGTIRNWDCLEKVLDHTYKNVLHVEPGSLPVVISETPGSTAEDRDRLARLMYDTFEVSDVYVVMDAVAELLTTGKGTGLVVQSGKTRSYTVPIYDGLVDRDWVRSEDKGRGSIDNHMRELLFEADDTLQDYFVYDEIWGDIVDELAYVAYDYWQEVKEAEKSSYIAKKYALPDGRLISVGSERFKSTEVLFDFDYSHSYMHGLQWLAFDSMPNDNSLTEDLLGNVLMTGINAGLPGIADRAKKEFIEWVPQSMEPNISALDQHLLDQGTWPLMKNLWDTALIKQLWVDPDSL